MSKVMTMKEAVSRYVESGDLLFISGAQHGAPAAAVAEIIRQKIDHLGVITCLTNTNTLIGEGLVDRLITGYSMLNENRSYALQKARENGKFPVVEESSHYGIALMLYAGYMGIPFMPTRSLVGSDMEKYNHENIKSIECPFTHTQVGAVRAVVPDIGIIHVQRADSEGNAQKWGTLGIDLEGINASRKIIVTTEEIVDSEVIRRDPNRTIIPGFRVNAVVEQPFGAYPSHLAGCYNDGPMVFGTMMGGKEAYEENLEETVYGVNDWNEYLENLKQKNGADFLDNLRLKNPAFSDPVASGYETIGGNEQ
ncbi:MAG: CoA transferase subunit A [Dehalococcoidales bacterium]|nr:MAG: CoA transferase subunit A [Dehalococcoidales bacterium]